MGGESCEGALCVFYTLILDILSGIHFMCQTCMCNSFICVSATGLNELSAQSFTDDSHILSRFFNDLDFGTFRDIAREFFQ